MWLKVNQFYLKLHCEITYLRNYKNVIFIYKRKNRDNMKQNLI